MVNTTKLVHGFLVGGIPTPLEKYESQLGLLFPIYIYIYVYIYGKNVPNHQPGFNFDHPTLWSAPRFAGTSPIYSWIFAAFLSSKPPGLKFADVQLPRLITGGKVRLQTHRIHVWYIC